MRLAAALRVLACCALAPGPALAGAWPRAVGDTFVSFGQEIVPRPDGTFDGYTSLYAEHGLRPRLTLGIKLGRSTTGPDVAYAFARRALDDGDGPNRLAAELGAGLRRHDDGRLEPVLRPGAAWGRGFETPLGPGWLSADARLQAAPVSGDVWGNLDLTLGLSPSGASHAIVQLRGYGDRYGRSATLAPSYVRRFGDRLRVETGLLLPLGDGDRGAFAAVWVEF